VSLLLTTPLTITRPGPEDEAGVAGTVTHDVHGMVIAITEAQRAAMIGDVPAGAVSIFLDPIGFGDTWTIKPGDTITDGTLTVRVGSVTPVSNPRTKQLKIVEASGGVS
jgi:hypothetical protein